MEVEQKPFTQKKPAQLVYLELGSGNGGMLLSISEDGFRFRAVAPVRANIEMPFAFSLDGKLRLQGSGIIEGLEDDCKSGGLRFTEVSEEFRASLRTWMASDLSDQSPGRELTPAVSLPLDTMEKIRQDIRSGYPPAHRPVKALEPVLPAVPPSAKNEIAARPPAVVQPIKKPKPPFRELESKPRDSGVTSHFIAKPLPKEPAPEKPALGNPAPLKPVAVSSAFLQPPVEKTAPRISVAPLVRPAASEAKLTSEPRPYIPPLEASFEEAWEKAKLSAPPASPQLSRAAAGSIIAIALAVILGAFGYNFRQEVGAIIIDVGQRISGENRPASSSAAVPEPAPDSTANAESGTTAKSVAPSVQTHVGPVDNHGKPAPALTAPDPSTANSARTNPLPNVKSGALSPSEVASKPAVNPPSAKVTPIQGTQTAIENPAKPPEIVESVTGETEFNAAQDILRGKSRSRDLPKAVDLLWVAVEKGHLPAEVTLADLFRRGDGVEKNCDQASVLLTAASKKGSADARKMLEQIVERGCQ